jgi:hypothetical protein
MHQLYLDSILLLIAVECFFFTSNSVIKASEIDQQFIDGGWVFGNINQEGNSFRSPFLS